MRWSRSARSSIPRRSGARRCDRAGSPSWSRRVVTRRGRSTSSTSRASRSRSPRCCRTPPICGTLTRGRSRGGGAFHVVNFEGQSVAVTAVLSNTADLWSVNAAALAAVPSAGKVKAESARDAIVPPGATSTGKIGAQAQAVVDEFKKGLADQDSWGADLMSRSDAIVAGPSAGQVARGKHAIQQMWKMRTKAGVREAASGELTAAVTPDGQLAWLSAPVTRVADGEDPLPLRIFAVHEREGAAWKMIVLHEAVAIDQPGSGTAFKKIVPPAPAPKVEPAKPDAKPAHAAKA